MSGYVAGRVLDHRFPAHIGAEHTGRPGTGAPGRYGVDQHALKLVALAIADRAEHDGTDTHPPLREIARRAQVAVDTARLAVNALVNLGYLTVTEPGTARRATGYAVNLAALGEPPQRAGQTRTQDDDQRAGQTRTHDPRAARGSDPRAARGSDPHTYVLLRPDTSTRATHADDIAAAPAAAAARITDDAQRHADIGLAAARQALRRDSIARHPAAAAEPERSARWSNGLLERAQ